jgi:hypothetical protein
MGMQRTTAACPEHKDERESEVISTKTIPTLIGSSEKTI